MAGKGLPSIIKACLYGRRHGQLLSLAYQQGALCDVALTSHFEKPKGFSVWLATIVWCLKASSLLIAHNWCLWYLSISIEQPKFYDFFVQYYMLLCITNVRLYVFEFGKWTVQIMRICNKLFEFWPQKTGGIGHERVTRSKKRHFLKFLVIRWLTDGYTDIYL